MKSLLTKIKINNYTYIFILLCFICGFIKNILIIFFICFIHELGHIFFIKLFNYDIISIEILPFGGYTTFYKKINSNINKDLIIGIGGFLNQLILFLFLLIFKDKINIITYNLFIKYNFLILIFNLLPIIPLDGNNIFHLILEKYFSYHISYHINFFVSLFFLIIFLIINYIYKFDNYFILGFLVYKLIVYYKNYKYLYKRFLLERYLYDLDYDKIENKTKSIKDLKKNVLHYFKINNHYVIEKNIIHNYLNNNNKL